MRSIRILHVGWGHPPVLGGGPIFYLHHLCLHQASQGMEPLCFVASSSRAGSGEGKPRVQEQIYEGVRYHRVENRPAHYFDWEDPARETDNPDINALFAETLQHAQPDIVHFHNLVGLSMSLPEVAKQHRCPTLFSVHNYWMLCPRDDLFAPNEEACPGPRDGARCAPCVGNPSKVAAFMQRISSARRILTQDVDLVLAVSGRVKEILVDFGIPDERILVQKIGSSAAENNWLRIGSRKVKTASGDGPIRFGYFGTMMARKGPHVILEALARLESTKKPFRVDLYGAGLSQAYRTRLDHLLARIPRLAETVHFMGGYTQRDMPGLLEDIDVAIIPPVWEDNGPQTVMEALGAGVPVIGARIGGIPDFVHHGVNGILFGPGKGAALASAMRRLLEETPLLDTLKSGITRPLTMREHAAALLNIYTSLARDGGKIVKRRRESSALKRKAASAIQRGELERAEACLQEALRCVPEDLETRQRLACLLGEMGRIDESLSHLRIVSKNRPGHAQAYNDMGVLCHRLGDTQQAIQHLERAVALEKENPLFLENMTAAYLSCGRVEDALTLYQKILSADPGNLDALAALGEICAVSNRGEDARFFWRKMLDIEPDNPFALKRLEGRPEESEGLSASL